MIQLLFGNLNCSRLVITLSFVGDRWVIFRTWIACLGVTRVKRSHSTVLSNAFADTGRQKNQNRKSINCSPSSVSALDETEIEATHRILLQGSSSDIAVDPIKSASVHFYKLNTNNDLCKLVTCTT